MYIFNMSITTVYRFELYLVVNVREHKKVFSTENVVEKLISSHSHNFCKNWIIIIKKSHAYVYCVFNNYV